MNGPSIGNPRQPADPRAFMVVVGAASRDLDETDPRGWRLGGTVSYAALCAARLGVPVRALIGVDAQAADAAELQLLVAAGVEVELVHLRRGPVFRNVDTDLGRVQYGYGPADRLRPTSLPATWRSPGAVLLGPVADELAPDWADAFPASTLVALAWQGLFRRLHVGGRRVKPVPLQPRRLMGRAEIAIVSSDDAAAGGAPLEELLRPGQQLVVTGAARGALHLERTEGGLRARYLPAFPARVVDPTGAGDVFLATWTAARLCAGRADPWRAPALATAAASLTVEAVGLAGVPDLDRLRLRLRGG